MQRIVEKLIALNKSISTMESATGGFIASSITNVENASKVFPFGAVTYITESKIKMGVPREIIETYGVYSIETAEAMSKAITELTETTFGLGITGKLQKDEEDPKVYISIYDREYDQYEAFTIEMNPRGRQEEKQLIEKKIEEKILQILEKH